MKKSKINIKLGNLFLVLLTIFLLIPGLLYILGSTMRKMEGEFLGKSKRYYGTASMELFTKVPKLIPTTGKVYYDIATGYYNVIEDKGVYSKNYSSYGELGNINRINKSVDNYRMGLALGEEDKFYGENLSMLINTLVSLGNNEETTKYIEEAKKSQNERIKNIGIINEIILMAKDGKEKEAIELCKVNMDKKDFEILYLNLIYNYGSAKEFNEELVKRVDKIKEELSEGVLEGSSTNQYMSYAEGGVYNIFLYKDIDLLKYVDFRCYTTFSERIDGSNVLEGQLTKDGKGVAYQRIAIGTISGYSNNREGNVLDSPSNRSVYTNEEGYYRFEGMADGSYNYEINFQGYLIDKSYLYLMDIAKEDQLEGINISDGIVRKDFAIAKYIKRDDNNIVEDKDWLTINVPNVEGAKSVRIQFSDDMRGYSLESKLDESLKVKIPLDDGSFMMRNFDSDEKYDPYGNEYIGTIGKKELYISMVLYDENNYIIGKTLPQESKYITKEKQLNPGDKLMLEGKYDEAVEWYNSKVEEEGIKRRYLYPIIKYYGDYTQRNTEEFEKYYNKLNEIELEDVEKNFLEGWGRS